MRFGLDESIIEKIVKVLEANPKVDKAFVFGSRAKGNYRPDSDIDIAIKGFDITLDDILQMSVAFEDQHIPYKIDLLDFYAIKEALLTEHIERAGIEVYSSWNEYLLEDIIEKFIDYRGKTPTKTTSGIPLITAKVVKGGRLIEPNEFIAESDYRKWMTRGFPEINDVILTTEAPLGEVALIKNKNIALAQRIITLQTRKEICNSIFLKYYFQSSEGQFALQSRSSGSTVEGIKSSELKKLMVFLPPLPEQNAIASNLSSIDDKIDLLHRQNKTLEQLAETLFRQWFVEEADESWEEKNLTEIADYLNGLALQKFPSTGIDSLPVIKIREMKQGISENTDQCSKRIPFQYIINDGDVLFSWSGSLEVVLWTGGEGALNQHLFKVTSKKYPKWFYYLATKYHLEDFKTIAESKSTTMGHIQREHLNQAIISIPPKDLFDRYDQQLTPLINKRIDNNNQIQTLIKLRDTLLPKLISGEVRVKV